MLVHNDNVRIPSFIPPLTIIKVCCNVKIETKASIKLISLNNTTVGFKVFLECL